MNSKQDLYINRVNSDAFLVSKQFQNNKYKKGEGFVHDKGQKKISRFKNIFAKKASVFTLSKSCGSITIEAALIIPVFIFAVLTLVFLMEAMAIKTNIRAGLTHAGKEIAQKINPVPMVSSGDVKNYIVDSIGSDRLDRSMIVGGSTGIDCSDSSMSVLTGKGTLTAEYMIKTPFSMFNAFAMQKEQITIKGWVGYVNDSGIIGNEEIVYITETGMVYHKDYNCTYLSLSIKPINQGEIEDSRNENGGKYYSCNRCSAAGAAIVYITDYGDKYHGKLSCSGLKRTIYSVPVSEAVGKGGCSKCCQ